MDYKNFYNNLKKATTWEIYQLHDVVIKKDLTIYMKKRELVRKPTLDNDEALLIECINLSDIINKGASEFNQITALNVIQKEAIYTVKGLVGNKAKIPDDFLNRAEKDIPMEDKKYKDYELFLEEYSSMIADHINLLKEIFIGMKIQEVNQSKYIQALIKLGYKNAEEMCGKVYDDKNYIEVPPNFIDEKDAGKTNLYF